MAISTRSYCDHGNHDFRPDGVKTITWHDEAEAENDLFLFREHQPERLDHRLRSDQPG